MAGFLILFFANKGNQIGWPLKSVSFCDLCGAIFDIDQVGCLSGYLV